MGSEPLKEETEGFEKAWSKHRSGTPESVARGFQMRSTCKKTKIKVKSNIEFFLLYIETTNFKKTSHSWSWNSRIIR